MRICRRLHLPLMAAVLGLVACAAKQPAVSNVASTATAAAFTCSQSQTTMFTMYRDAWNGQAAALTWVASHTSPQFERTSEHKKPSGSPANYELWNHLTTWPWQQTLTDSSGQVLPQETQLTRYIRGVRYQWDTTNPLKIVADPPKCVNAQDMLVTFKLSGSVRYGALTCTVTDYPGESALTIDTDGNLLRESMHLIPDDVDICAGYTGPAKNKPTYSPPFP